MSKFVIEHPQDVIIADKGGHRLYAVSVDPALYHNRLTRDPDPMIVLAMNTAQAERAAASAEFIDGKLKRMPRFTTKGSQPRQVTSVPFAYRKQELESE